MCKVRLNCGLYFEGEKRNWILKLKASKSNTFFVLGRFAVCLDGTLPGYHIHRGFGSGANSWIVNLEVCLTDFQLCCIVIDLIFMVLIIRYCDLNYLESMKIENLFNMCNSGKAKKLTVSFVLCLSLLYFEKQSCGFKQKHEQDQVCLGNVIQIYIV